MIFIGHSTQKAEYTFFSSAHGTFSRTDHILGHKTSLNKFKGIGIISSIVSDHDSIKLEINNRKRNKKKNNYMETKQRAPKIINGSMVKSKKKFKNTLRQMTMKTQPYKIYGETPRWSSD